MRRAWLVAAAVVVLAAPAAPAQFVFMQYTMKVPRPQQNQPGQPAQPGGPPAQPAQPGGATAGDSEFISIPVHGVVEVKSAKEVPNFAQQRIKAIAQTPWGTSTLYSDGDLITRVAPVPSVRARFKAKEDSVNKKRTPEKLYELAEWCLTHGLVGEFAEVMNDVASGGKKTELDKLDRAVEAYTQVKAGLAQPLEREDAAGYWRGRLGFRMSQSPHYALLYNASLNNPPEVEQRLKALEENMKAFYYAFALKGIALAMPDQKLVAVMLDQPDQFVIQRALVEDEPLVADSFFSPRDNVVVFSSQRLDNASVRFSKYMQGLYQKGWDRDVLLKGDAKTSRLAGKTPDERERMSTLALLDKAMEVEAERASVSHDGTRQLFVACGLQKAAVVLPDWVQFGMASYFETPKGPFPGAPPEVTVAYWPGYGSASWKYTRLFKRWAPDLTKPNENALPFRSRAEFTAAGAALENVIRDEGFSEARAYGPVAGQLKLLQARSMAWSLCHFLLKQRPAGVMKFYTELSNLPRDLLPEPDGVLACFCRAFDVANTTGTGMDRVKFEELAKDWLGYMKTVRSPGEEINLEVPQQPGTPGATPPGGPQPKGGNPPKGGP